MPLFKRGSKTTGYVSRWENNYTYEVALAGILIGLNLAVKIVFDFIPSAPLGITFSPTYFVLAISAYLLKKRVFVLAVLFISPWLWFVAGRAASVNVADFVMEYLIPVLFLFPVAFLPHFERSKTAIGWEGFVAAFILITADIAVVRLFLTTYAGVVWYKVTWVGSIVFNWPNTYVDLALTTALFLITYKAFFALRTVVR